MLDEGSASLRYYHTEEEARRRIETDRCIALSAATLFVKETPKDIAKGHYRFTLTASTAGRVRELKLRAETAETCQAWVGALTGSGRARVGGISSGAPSAADLEDERCVPASPAQKPARTPAPRLASVRVC